MKLKRYLKNLWLAMTGRNPYKVELDEVTRQRDYAEAAACEWNDFSETALHENAKLEQQVEDYQNLTENLRRHLTEKDIRTDEMKRDYLNAVNTMREQHRLQRGEMENRIDELQDTVDSLTKQLKKVNRDIGREMKSANLLTKTNAALADLCAAIASEDEEKVRHAVVYLDWNSTLSRIAQLHLNVLVRKKEPDINGKTS